MLLLLVLSGTICGCGPSASPGPDSSASHVERRLLLAIDDSGSTAALRKKLMLSSWTLVQELDPSRDDLRVYRFAKTNEEFYSQVPTDQADFADQLRNNVLESSAERGTDYAAMFAKLAQVAASADCASVDCFVAGDGEDDFMGNQGHREKYRKAALQLISNPKVRSIRVWGVLPAGREEIRQMFEGDHGKLELLSTDQDPGD